jgi:hypothetical protein
MESSAGSFHEPNEMTERLTQRAAGWEKSQFPLEDD